jgi:hypothetical protein
MPAIRLLAAVWLASPPAGPIVHQGLPGLPGNQLPPYPAAQVSHMGGMTLYATQDPVGIAAGKYRAQCVQAGWRTVSWGTADERAPGTLLSFEKGSQVADVWVAAAPDAHHKSRTIIMFLSPQDPQGVAHGRPAR